MSLKSILEKITEQEEILAQPLDPESKVYGTMQAQQRNAREALNSLNFEYKTTLISQTLLIVAKTESSEVAKHAEELGTFIAYGDSAINNAVNSLDEGFLGKSLSAQTLDDAISIIEDTAVAAGVSGMHISNTLPNLTIIDKSDLADALASPLSQEGNSAGLFLIEMDRLAKKALSEKFDLKVFPVMLTTEHEVLAKSFMSDMSDILPSKPKLISDSVLDIDGEILLDGYDEESVKKALEKVKKSMNPKKQNKKNIADTELSETVEQE